MSRLIKREVTLLVEQKHVLINPTIIQQHHPSTTMERYLNLLPRNNPPPINADPLNDRHPRVHFYRLAFTQRALDSGIAALGRDEIDTSSSAGYTFYRHQATGINVLVVVSCLFIIFLYVVY